MCWSETTCGQRDRGFRGHDPRAAGLRSRRRHRRCAARARRRHRGGRRDDRRLRVSDAPRRRGSRAAGGPGGGQAGHGDHDHGLAAGTPPGQCRLRRERRAGSPRLPGRYRGDGDRRRDAALPRGLPGASLPEVGHQRPAGAPPPGAAPLAAVLRPPGAPGPRRGCLAVRPRRPPVPRLLQQRARGRPQPPPGRAGGDRSSSGCWPPTAGICTKPSSSSPNGCEPPCHRSWTPSCW